MIENFDELFLILFQTILIFGVLFTIYKKQIFSFFDPLLFYILTQAFSIELGILQITDWGYLTSFLMCQLFFAFGFNYVAKSIRNNNIIDDTGLLFKKNEYKFWVYFTTIGFIIVLLANIYLISVQGVILFSDDPTTGKVAAFEGGGGIGAVRRINWGLLNLVNLSTLFIYIKTKKKLFLIMLITLVLIAVSGGSKSSLLIYVVLLAFLGQFKSINQTRVFKSIEKNFRVTLFIFDSFGLGLFTIIGIQKGLNADLHPIICLTLGTITGCFGGIIRDILLNRIPLVFRKEIYATACIVGGSVFLLMANFTALSYSFVQIFTILLIVAIRTLAVKYHWQMPKFYGYGNDSEM